MDLKQTTEVPIDRGWAWMVLLGMFVCSSITLGIGKSFGILLDEFVDYFNIPVALAATIMGVSAVVFTIAAPLSVTAGEHFSHRKVVILGGLVGGLGICFSGLLFSIEWVIFTCGATIGFGNASAIGNGLVMVGQYFDKRRSLANGLALSGSGIGLFVIPPLLQFLLDTYGLRGTLIIVGGLYLNVIVCAMLYRPLSFYTRSCKTGVVEKVKLMTDEDNMETGQSCYGPDTEEIKRCEFKDLVVDDTGTNIKETVKLRCKTVAGDVNIDDASGDSRAVKETKNGFTSRKPSETYRSVTRAHKFKLFMKSIVDLSVFRSYTVCLFVLSVSLAFFGNFNFALFMPAAAFNKGVDKYQKAWLVSINGLCELAGRITMGVTGDLNILKKYQLMALSTLLLGIAVFCFSFADRFWIFTLFVGLYGFSAGGYTTIFVPTIIDLFGFTVMPKLLAVTLFCQGIGTAIGQPTLGAIRDATGNYQIVNIVNAAAIFVGTALLFMYPTVQRIEKRRNHDDTDV